MEKYLLVPRAIAPAVEQRLRERRGSATELAPIQETIDQLLEVVTDEMKPDVIGQVVIHRLRHFQNRSRLDACTIMSETFSALDRAWRDVSVRLRLVPGKQVLSANNSALRRIMQVSMTAP